MMDLVGERNMLSEYVDVAVFEADALETDQPQKEFWKGLREELMVDYEAVDKESVAFRDAATELGKFEYASLDNDGKVTRLEEALGQGSDYLSHVW